MSAAVRALRRLAALLPWNGRLDPDQVIADTPTVEIRPVLPAGREGEDTTTPWEVDGAAG